MWAGVLQERPGGCAGLSQKKVSGERTAGGGISTRKKPCGKQGTKAFEDHTVFS